MTCSNCGAVLDEDFVCRYCGTRYVKPQPTTNVTNNNYNNVSIVINPGAPSDVVRNTVNAAVFGPDAVEGVPYTPESEQVSQEEEDTPEISDSSMDVSQENSNESLATKIARSSFLLYMCALIAVPVFLYLWRLKENDIYILGAIISALIVWFISSHYKGGK